MSPRDRFQYDLTTGRWSLPVVAVFTLLVWWVFAERPLSDFGALVCVGLTPYLLGELNTRFMLVRTRTTSPSWFFLLLVVVTPYLFRWSAGCMLPVFFSCMLFSLFRSYESHYASTTIFHAFLFLGLCSLVFPHFLWLVLPLYLHMIPLRSFSAKTFFAGLVGVSIPYWLAFGYSLYSGDSVWFQRLALRPFRLEMPDYVGVPIPDVIMYGVVALLYVCYVVFYFQSAYKDKVHTRILLNTVVWMGVWINLLILLCPQALGSLLPVLFVPTAILAGHLYSLTFGLYVRISFYVTLGLLFLLFLFHIWIHLFNC